MNAEAEPAGNLPAPAHAATGRELHRLVVLDSIRGLAALVVVVHHCLLTQPAFSDYFFSNWHTQARTTLQAALFDTPARIVWAGYEAVILFYVLSGLVLALPWVDGRPAGYGAFLVKRVCRIYLPYVVAVGLAAVLAVVLSIHAPIAGLSDWVNTMNWSNPVTVGVLANHAFLTGHHNVIDGPIHSLVWEMRVSVLFPLIALPIVRWRWRGIAGVSIVLCAAIAAIQWRYAGNTGLFRLLTTNPGLGAAGKLALEAEWTAYFALFFVMGTAIALNLQAVRTGLARAPGWLRGACLLAGLLAVQAHWSHLELIQDFMVGVGACLLIAAALAPGRIHAVLSHPTLAWLGAVSYSLYLVHVPLLLAALILLHGVVPVWAVLLAVPPASILAAWAFDHWVAKPCVRLGQAIVRARPAPSGAALTHRAVAQLGRP